MIKTKPSYWDCKCDDQYIHRVTGGKGMCCSCGAVEEESPESRQEEVEDAIFTARNLATYYAVWDCDDARTLLMKGKKDALKPNTVEEVRQFRIRDRKRNGDTLELNKEPIRVGAGPTRLLYKFALANQDNVTTTVTCQIEEN